MKAVFFGTPDIAVPSLRALAEVADVVAVVCQPDRPKGRGLALAHPPVKEAALAMGLPVHQPTKVKTPDFAAWLRDLGADVALVIAYGRILPKAVLDAPRRGCVNLHASILPELRGAAPITWAVVRGHGETGISLMQMDEGMDTGPVYVVESLAIGPNETAGELSVRLGDLAAQVTRRHLADVVAGKREAVPQDASRATHAPMLSKEDGRIRWDAPAPRVHDHVRGMSPWPGAFAERVERPGKDGQRAVLKVLETRVAPVAPSGAVPGAVVSADKGGLFVAAEGAVVEIVRGQLVGGKALSGRELAQGRAVLAGEHLA